MGSNIEKVTAAIAIMGLLAPISGLRNQTYSTNQSIPIDFVYHYRTLQTDDFADTFITRHSDKACFHNGNNTEPFKFPDDFEGTFYSYTLTNPSIKMIKVLDSYDRFTQKLEVEFNSDWSSVSGANATENIRNAVVNGTISRISFSTYSNPDAFGTCSSIPLVNVDLLYCLNQNLYSKIIGDKPVEESNISCVVGYNRQSKYYMGLWDSVAPAGSIFYKRCILNTSEDINFQQFKDNTELFNDYPYAFACHRAHGGNTLFCRDPKMKIIWVSNSAWGVMRSMTAHMEYDVTDGITLDMSIDLKEWNVDFSELFINTFNYCSFIQPVVMTIDLYVKIDKPPEEPPGISVMYYVYALIILALCIVLVLAILLLVCTCSARGLETEIWDYAKPCSWLKKLSNDYPPEKDVDSFDNVDRHDSYKLSELP